MSNRIPIPSDVCSLDGAIRPGISISHWDYVTCSVGEGVECCLFKVRQSDETTTFEDALTVPPTETAGRIFATRVMEKSHSRALQKAFCQQWKGSAETGTSKTGGID